jgi:hypothetical protein
MTSPTTPFSRVLSITFSGGGKLTDGAGFAGTRTLSGSDGSSTLTGTPADINAEGDALSFIGVPNPSFTLSDQSISAVTVSFDGADGAKAQAGLTIDAAGDLFGTTSGTVSASIASEPVRR